MKRAWVAGRNGYEWVYLGLNGYKWVYLGLFGYGWVVLGLLSLGCWLWWIEFRLRCSS